MINNHENNEKPNTNYFYNQIVNVILIESNA
jgi:hypothetical protein